MSTIKEEALRTPLKSGAAEEEPSKPQKIGAGSFAAIYVVPGTPVAYKVVHFAENHDELKREFEALQSLYATLNDGLFFRIPQPAAFYDADNEVLVVDSRGPGPVRDPQAHVVARIDASFFDELGSNNPVYAMDRIFPLRGHIAAPICTQFMPDSVTTTPKLCRLYFGKTLGDGRGARFVNTNNFPLDVQRYEWFRATSKERFNMILPSAEKVAEHMGEMLGWIHWICGYDARDVEFVIGGDGFNGVLFYVLDFNQMRPWNKDTDDVSVLADSFFLNDPYFPRPRDARESGGLMYAAFSEGYLRVGHRNPGLNRLSVRPDAFLEAIEKRDGIGNVVG